MSPPQYSRSFARSCCTWRITCAGASSPREVQPLIKDHIFRRSVSRRIHRSIRSGYPAGALAPCSRSPRLSSIRQQQIAAPVEQLANDCGRERAERLNRGAGACRPQWVRKPWCQQGRSHAANRPLRRPPSDADLRRWEGAAAHYGLGFRWPKLHIPQAAACWASRPRPVVLTL
jgi:hypothetical protein